ncbi:amidohydrolase family protein [Chryseobacterium gossypii]|uniref:amidohydrolase family protein n=1 Tax=Chryseobacterium gossypii TaxID=3231602 RepID=UPI00352661B3
MHKYSHYFILWVLLMMISGCAGRTLTQNDHRRKNFKQEVLAIRHVNIIPMTATGGILFNSTVIIEKGKIISINGPVPGNAKTINGRGKWLIPGLIDMHVHIPTDISFRPASPTKGATLFFDTQDIMTPFIANGVTTVFDLNSKAEHFGQRNEIAKGNVIGPRMALAALINGGEESGRVANTPSEGRQTVRIIKAEGYEFVKVYSGLNIETFQAITDEARKQGLKVIGHIPDAFKGKLEQAFVPNFGMVAHAEEFSKQAHDFSDEEARRFARLSKQNGTWLTPTLTTMVWIASQARSLDELRASPTLQYVHPLLQSKWLTANNYNKNTTPRRVNYFESMVKFHNRLVRAFKEAGVPIVAGTDTGVSGVVAGFSLHDELGLLVNAGLTPEEALTSATRLPAIWLGIDKEIGTIEAGKSADLVLLSDNPLTDIKNTRKIAGVCINGRWIDKSKIEAMLSDLSRRNNAMKPNYDWSKRKEY